MTPDSPTIILQLFSCLRHVTTRNVTLVISLSLKINDHIITILCAYVYIVFPYLQKRQLPGMFTLQLH